MKTALGQINTTPGDFAGNVSSIKEGIDHAAENGCDLIVFPELSVPGYLSQDLIYHREFVDQNLKALDDLVGYTKDLSSKLHVVVGFIDRNPGIGKPFFNMAAVILNGEIIGKYKKQLLPFYDVFDELRYFEPGTELLILNIADKKVGIGICEDLWNDKNSDGYNYETNPMHRYCDAGVDIIVSLNSSPYVHEKPWQRIKTIMPGLSDSMSIIYVNQIGGQDELVFDGQSFVVSNGKLIHQSTEVNNNTFEIVDLFQPSEMSAKEFVDLRREVILESTPSLRDLLVLCLRDYVEKSGFNSIVLASSGGVDSAVVCDLACSAVGAENVHAIRMPSIFSSDHARTDAIELHENLGCWDYEVEISHEDLVSHLNDTYHRYPDNSDNLVTQKMASGYQNVANENMQARLRDIYLMHFSNAYGAMPLSTGNKTESACGYYTHFDMNFSFAPIKDLYKFQVFDLAKASAKIPGNIWQKAPSAELAEGQTDEASLMPYAILDPIVCAYVEDYISTFAEFKQWAKTFSNDYSEGKALLAWSYSEEASADFHRIIGLIGRMEYKRRQTCPGTKVSKVAFGIGRRIPIVERWS